MNTDPINMIDISQQLKKKDWTYNLMEIIDQWKQSIEANKSEYPSGNLTTTVEKPDGEFFNVWIGYGPQTIF